MGGSSFLPEFLMITDIKTVIFISLKITYCQKKLIFQSSAQIMNFFCILSFKIPLLFSLYCFQKYGILKRVVCCFIKIHMKNIYNEETKFFLCYYATKIQM